MLNREIIYDAPQKKFFEDVRLDRFADIMKKNFEENTGRSANVEYDSRKVTGDKFRNSIFS